MTSLSHDAAFLQSAAQVLEDYLLSEVLFWPLQREKGAMLGGDSDQLTPGNLLLSLARLSKEDLAEPSIQTALQRIDEVRQRWKSAWLNKCRKEWEQRLRLWLHYVDDLQREDGRVLPADYSFHVRQRVILELLGKEIGDLPPEKRLKLQSADEVLRSLSQPGEFIWQKGLQERFPASSFWYLYMKTGRGISE